MRVNEMDFHQSTCFYCASFLIKDLDSPIFVSIMNRFRSALSRCRWFRMVSFNLRKCFIIKVPNKRFPIISTTNQLVNQGLALSLTNLIDFTTLVCPLKRPIIWISLIIGGYKSLLFLESLILGSVPEFALLTVPLLERRPVFLYNNPLTL